jgi:phosphate transport system permease protein
MSDAIPADVVGDVPDGGAEKRIDLSSGRVGDDAAVRALLLACALIAGLAVTLVIFFVVQRALPVFRHQGLFFITHGGWDTQLENAWTEGGTRFGVKALIVGSVLSTLGSVFLTVILGLGCAIFIAELAPGYIRRPFETIVQLLAGIPSVVFGLVGIGIVVPLIINRVPQTAVDKITEVPIDGTSLLAAIIVLTFMILPFFVTVAVDTLRSIPRSYMNGGLALGMTKWRTITRIQVPASTPGLLAGMVLAAARAIGEAIAISMVAGSIAFIPNLNHGPFYALLMPIRTMASAIVETGPEAMEIPAIGAALFGLATLLLVFSLLLSIAARWAFGAFNRRMGVASGRTL